MSNNTQYSSVPVLIGNTFPLVLVRRKTIIAPYPLGELKARLAAVGVERIISFWGHKDTLPVANATLGVDVTPRIDRPVLSLSPDSLPMLFGHTFDEVFILSPDYKSGIRPALGAVVAVEAIASWQVLKITFTEEKQ